MHESWPKIVTGNKHVGGIPIRDFASGKVECFSMVTPMTDQGIRPILPIDHFHLYYGSP